VTGSLTERYLRLGLQIGRHVDGIVDSYYGPPVLEVEVDTRPPVEPRALVADAEALLDELEDGWVRDQMLGLRTYAGVLAGESYSYADEVEGCYGVRPTYTEEAVFEAAHEDLERLLPGEGPLGDRYRRWEDSIRIPTEAVERTVAAVLEEARVATRVLAGLPDGEGVDLVIVREVPWLGFCEYRGHLRSQISVNVDLPMSALELLVLTIHETYAGHHAESCSKEQALVREQGLLEQTIALVPTPQSVVSEGIAALAPDVLLEGESRSVFAAVLHEAGIDVDLDHVLAVRHATEPCRWAEVNAALMLHDGGAGEDDVRAYLERWGLNTPELATHIVRFLKESTSRTYITTYHVGHELCRAFVAGDPERFGRLLTEQIRVRDLVAEQAAAE
jgi:hypothetical protein